ncbi:MAG TPA: hypothetical protein VJR89_42265 [Polyangiales bacterium]|nr:hypothetical protein [Polyangiales bacterium]
MHRALIRNLCIALACSCAEAVEAPLEISVDADDALRPLVSEVNATVEMREPREAAWNLLAQQRFELERTDSWPLRFRVRLDPAAEGDAYALRADARDERGAVVARARVMLPAEQAREAGLSVTLEQGEPDTAPVEPECLEPAPFCDGERIVRCSGERRQVLPCGENERCVIVSELAFCECRPGFVAAGTQGCVRPEAPRP